MRLMHKPSIDCRPNGAGKSTKPLTLAPPANRARLLSALFQVGALSTGGQEQHTEVAALRSAKGSVTRPLLIARGSGAAWCRASGDDCVTFGRHAASPNGPAAALLSGLRLRPRPELPREAGEALSKAPRLGSIPVVNTRW